MTTIDPPPPSGLPTSVPPPAPPAARALPTRDETPVLRWAELMLLAPAAWLINVSVRSGLDNVAAVAATLLVLVALAVGSRLPRPTPRLLVLGALVLAPWLYIRSAAGLTAATVAAVAGLLALAAGLSREGRFSDLRAIGGLVNHIAAQVSEWVHGLAMVKRLLERDASEGRWKAIGRGTGLAAPMVIVFGVLLASADRVFADLLRIGDAPSLLGHAVLTSCFLLALLGLVSRAAHRTPAVEVSPPRALSPVEVTVVLGSVAALFAAFVGTQALIAVGGIDHVFETEGLTRAEHARSGFFQLLWVAALALVMLGALRAVRTLESGTARDRFRPLALVILALTLVITAISIQRLWLYVDAFGLTPLRLWSLATAGWIGVIIVAYGLSIAGVAGDRSWFPGFFVASAGTFVLMLNIANPDGLVTRYNMLNPPSERAVDTAMIASLSDDAVPIALELVGELPGDSRIDLVTELCRRLDLESGVLDLTTNRAERRADALLDELCPARVPALD